MSTNNCEPILDIVVLNSGESLQVNCTIREYVIVILGGKCNVSFDNGLFWENIGSREDVFGGPATALYTGTRRQCTIECCHGVVSLALISGATTSNYAPLIILPENVRIEFRGTREWKREVHTIIDSTIQVGNLLIGETFHSQGVWSGYPPHKHDASNLPSENILFEKFLIRVEPTNGFGIYLNYSNGSPINTTIVRNWDIISCKSGYHSFVSAGGYKFYYLWALWGINRTLKWSNDPVFEWINN